MYRLKKAHAVSQVGLRLVAAVMPMLWTSGCCSAVFAQPTSLITRPYRKEWLEIL